MIFYIGAETTMLFGVGLTRGQNDWGRTGIGAASTCFLLQHVKFHSCRSVVDNLRVQQTCIDIHRVYL